MMTAADLFVMAATNPAALPLMAIPLLMQLRQFYQSGPAQFLPPSWEEIVEPWRYGDRVRKLTLQRIFGSIDGEKVWNSEWNQRSIQIDLRSRSG